MAAQRFSFIFRGSIHFVAPPADWWKDASTVELIRDAMQRAGLWLELPNVGRRARRLRAMTDPADVARWTTTWKLDEAYCLSRENDGSLTDTTLQLTPRKEGLQFFFVPWGDDAESLRDTVLDRVVAFARDMRDREVLGGVRLWDWEVFLQREYPTPRPVLHPRLWSAGVVLMIVDRDYFVQFAHFKEQAARDLDHVLAAPVPRGATREDHGPLAIFRFVDDLTDDAAIDRAAAEQHRWIVGLVGTESSSFTNEHGDRRVLLLTSARHTPLTIYDSIDKHGFQAVFVIDGGGGDADLDEAAQWLTAKQLPDGTPVEGLSIIAPTRDAAIAAADRVRSRGFDRVLYIDNSGDLWNPFGDDGS